MNPFDDMKIEELERLYESPVDPSPEGAGIGGFQNHLDVFQDQVHYDHTSGAGFGHTDTMFSDFEDGPTDHGDKFKIS